MKVALIYLSYNDTNKTIAKIDGVLTAFKKDGVLVDFVSVVNKKDDIGFRRQLIELKECYDCVFVFGGDKAEFPLKEIIAELFETTLEENAVAREIVEKNIVDKNDDVISECATLPFSSTIIPNTVGVYQGFIIDGADVVLFVLPTDNEISALNGYAFPYIATKYNCEKTKKVIKFFGDNKPLKEMLDRECEANGNKMTYNIIQNYGDNTVNLFFDKDFDIHKEHDVLRRIVGEFYENIYAEYDVSLSERLFDLLRLKSLKISTAESFTAGNIVSSIISNSGASEVVIEGIVCYSDRSKIKRVNVSEEDIITDGAVSSTVAYQMAVGLLDNRECDVAIATTGIAGPKSDNTKKPVGLSYIAVGTRKGVHVYKYNLSGSREEITKKATNNALFLTIELLKKY